MGKKWENIDWDDYGVSNIRRPTEDLALANIARDVKTLKLNGRNLNFSNFEWRIFNLDRQVQEARRKQIDNRRDKNQDVAVVYELSKLTGYSNEFIKMTLYNIDNKIYLRDRLGMSPYPKHRKNKSYVKTV